MDRALEGSGRHDDFAAQYRLQSADLEQAATVEAIFVYNTAMRDQMLPRKPLPHPELEEQRKAPLKKLMPGAVEVEEKIRSRRQVAAIPPCGAGTPVCT